MLDGTAQLEPAYRHAAPEGRHETLLLPYDEVGYGKTVVLLHGLPLDRRVWAPFMQHCPDGYRYVAFDLPGFGEARGRAAGERALLHSARLLALSLNVLGITRAHFVAHSFGAYVLAELLRLVPSCAASITLIAGRFSADTPARAAERLAAAARLEAGERDFFIELQRRACSSFADAGCPPEIQRMILENVHPCIAPLLRAAAARQDMRGVLRCLGTPVAMICGEADTEMTNESLKLIATHQRAALHVLPGAGHMLNYTLPRACVEICTQHWRRNGVNP